MSGVPKGKILVGTWTLSATSLQPAAATESIVLDHGDAEGESIFDPDNRELVAAKDFAPGGKYRSIVKLQMRYEKQAEDDDRIAMGTGWLIRPDLMATAGHNVYNWSNNFGRAKEIKAYIGYNGKESVKNASVQARLGATVVTTAGWLTGPDYRTNDVAFIKLDRPFTDIVPFSFKETPLRGQDRLGVVGYPADQKLNNERGAQMYEMFTNVKYDITTTQGNMLEYYVSTFGGQSGSPVLLEGTNVSIGAHVYGGGDKNKASPIMGKYGNPYWSYISVFDKVYTVSTVKQGISFVLVDILQQPLSLSKTASSGEEGFFDVLKSVINIGAPIASKVITFGTPFLGPVGGPVAALAGTVLTAASKLAESALTESGFSESAFNQDHLATPQLATQHASRAVLAEAALQTILSKDHELVAEFGLFDKMKSIYKSVSPVLVQLAPKILPVVTDAGLRIALDRLDKVQKGEAITSQPVRRLQALKINATEASIATDPDTEAFLNMALKPTKVVPGEEGFFDDLGDILSTGLRQSKGLIGGAVSALNVLGSLLPEAEMEPSASEQHMITLCQRHLMGEAALQALTQVPPHQLEAEGFFDDFKTIAQRIGGAVVKSAPGVIQAALPIVRGIIAARSNTGVHADGLMKTVSGAKPLATTSTKVPLKAKKSVQDFLLGSTDQSVPAVPALPTRALVY